MVLGPAGSVGTHPGCPEWRSDVPILFQPFCLWEKRVELTEQPHFTELLSYLVAVVLNYGLPSVLGELSSQAPWKPRVGFRSPSQGPSVAT